MKIIGTIIIGVCLAVNVAIGLFIFGNSQPRVIDVSGMNLQEKKYESYGFSIFTSKDFESLGSKVESNILEAFVVDTKSDDFEPILQIDIKGDVSEGDIKTSDEYRKLSSEEFKRADPAYEFQYQDGGITTNSNGVKIYFDTVSLMSSKRLITEKTITFFHKNNQIRIGWTDDKDSFSKTVPIFDKVIDTIKTY